MNSPSPDQIRQARDPESSYQKHLYQERISGFHPDGCWYCGSDNHQSDCCEDELANLEAWE